MGRAVNADSMAAPGSESPLLAAGVLHETGWVFCWAAQVVSEVIWVGLSAGMGERSRVPAAAKMRDARAPR